MKYFTKYLPVEGEIKEGDNYTRSGSTEVLKSENKVLFHEKTQGEVTGLNHTLWSMPLQKVKLFLCSHEIQRGGRARMPNKPEVEFDVAGGNHIELIERGNGFTVIGEISPQATWVTMGMEFEFDDWEDQTDKNNRMTGFIGIRCPNCKRFH